MSFNTQGTFNNGFLGTNSQKPIVGVVGSDFYKLSLNQYKVATGTGSSIIAPGEAVNVLVNSNEIYAGSNDGNNCGFLVHNQSDVVEAGSTAPIAQKGQIVNVALFGSGIEIYLAVNDGLSSTNIYSVGTFYWDATNKCVTNNATNATLNITMLTGVVDGVKVSYDDTTGVASFVATKCARFRI